MRFSILVREDNEKDRKLIARLLDELPQSVEVLGEDEEDHGIDIVIAGISGNESSEGDRIEDLMQRVRRSNPHVQLILCAPAGMPDLDKLILDLQARAFLQKPLDRENFTSLIGRTLSLLEKRRLKESRLKDVASARAAEAIIGSSSALEDVLQLARKVSRSGDTSVLLLGESGTGKSLFAKAIHEMSNRSPEPFIEINCAALPPNLLESELFGYEPGAFTDAKTEKMGLIELADRGTLFLDEITEVDVPTQAKLLKFLDTKKIRRLGGSKDLKVDVRVIAASNRDILEEVKKGNFREDLYYRLNVVSLTIPPLRERPEDIVEIATHYFEAFKKKFHKTTLTLSREAMELIRGYHWPGNVRELINVLERAVLLAHGDAVTPSDLPLPRSGSRKSIVLERGPDDIAISIPPEGVRLDEVERALIIETLRKTHGNVVQAARLLGLNRGALRYKIAKYKIDPREFQRKGIYKARETVYS
jgi:DNA-binding NtrC family response regulator